MLVLNKSNMGFGCQFQVILDTCLELDVFTGFSSFTRVTNIVHSCFTVLSKGFRVDLDIPRGEEFHHKDIYILSMRWGVLDVLSL